MDFVTPPPTRGMLVGRAGILAFIALGTVVAVAYAPTQVTAAGSVSAAEAQRSEAAPVADVEAEPDATPDPTSSHAPIAASVEADFSFAEAGVEIAEPTLSTIQAGVANPPAQVVSGEAVLAEARKWVGSPYLAGGSTPSGFDCSGFTSFVYGNLGVSVPRSSGDYWDFGVVVSPEDALPGDILVLEGHVAIYAGNGQIVDSSRPGTVVHFRDNPFTDYFFVRVT